MNFTRLLYVQTVFILNFRIGFQEPDVWALFFLNVVIDLSFTVTLKILWIIYLASGNLDKEKFLKQ